MPFAGKLDWLSKAIGHLDGNPITPEALSTIGVTHSESVRAKRIEFHFHPRSKEVPLAAQIDGEEFVSTTPTQLA